MAKVYLVHVIYPGHGSHRVGMSPMKDSEFASRSDMPSRERNAEKLVSGLFEGAGWNVRRNPDHDDPSRPDVVVRRGQASYVIEVKAAAEGRSDRLIPLWSQAYIQAARAAGDRHAPLAIVAAPKISLHIAEQVLRFAAEYAPDAAVGEIGRAHV